jgi:hypothetical protein
VRVTAAAFLFELVGVVYVQVGALPNYMTRHGTQYQLNFSEAANRKLALL